MYLREFFKGVLCKGSVCSVTPGYNQVGRMGVGLEIHGVAELKEE